MAIRLHPSPFRTELDQLNRSFSIPFPFSSPFRLFHRREGRRSKAMRSSTVSIRSRKFVEREIWTSPGCTTNSSPNTSPFPSPFEFNRPIRSLNRRNCSPYFTRGPPRFPRVCAHYPWPLHPLPAPLPSG